MVFIEVSTPRAAAVDRIEHDLPDFSVIDGLLAATALHYDLTLVTRDITHVATTAVTTFNPWTQ